MIIIRRVISKSFARLKAAVALSLLWIAICCPALGADVIRLPAPTKQDLSSILFFEVSGLIEQGDTAKVEKLLATNKFEDGFFAGNRAVAVLDSSGGNFHEGIELGLFFASHHVETLVTNGSVCWSACALAFMGGSLTGEEGVAVNSRALVVGGKLGFHAPYLEVPDGRFSKQSVDAAFDVAIAVIAELASNAPTLGLRSSLLPTILRKGRNEVYEIRTVDDLGLFKVATRQSFVPQALTRSMAINLCRNDYEWHYDTSAISADMPPAEVANMEFYTPEFGDSKRANRTVVKTAYAGEGGFEYCILDHVLSDGKLEVACRGFIYALDLNEATKSAKALDKNGEYGNPDVPCDSLGAMNAMDGYDEFMNRPRSFAFAPADTPIETIDIVLRKYQSEEVALTASR